MSTSNYNIHNMESFMSDDWIQNSDRLIENALLNFFVDQNLSYAWIIETETGKAVLLENNLTRKLNLRKGPVIYDEAIPKITQEQMVWEARQFAEQGLKLSSIIENLRNSSIYKFDYFSIDSESAELRKKSALFTYTDETKKFILAMKLDNQKEYLESIKQQEEEFENINRIKAETEKLLNEQTRMKNRAELEIEKLSYITEKLKSACSDSGSQEERLQLIDEMETILSAIKGLVASKN